MRPAFRTGSRTNLRRPFLRNFAADERWEVAFAESQAALKQLADEALKGHRAGRTEALDPIAPSIR